MRLIERYIENNESTWMWFILTIFASALPMIARYLMSLAVDIDSYDIKDVFYGGLAMNLSNLNLVGTRKVDAKVVLIGLSFILMFILTLCIAIFLMKENKEHELKNFNVLAAIGYLVVFFSIILSYEANKYVLKNN